MSEHQGSQAITSGACKVRWLAALDELEEEFRAFQQRRGAAAWSAALDGAAAQSAPDQLILDLRLGS